MNVLVACEESQRVCIEFRKKNHNAFSCDLLDCSGGHPEWHIKCDVTGILNGDCGFMTCDGKIHSIIGKWDMIIAFPPCTDLAISGAAWFEKKRKDGRQLKSIEFFVKFLTCNCDRVSIENPVNIISGNYIYYWFPDICEKYNLPLKPSQMIQPYMFGDKARKKTCLWLKGLNNLIPTNIVDEGDLWFDANGNSYSVGASANYATDENGKIIPWNDPRTGIIRSKTFPGIAKAMAEQWG